jgi:hypothetical protein
MPVRPAPDDVVASTIAPAGGLVVDAHVHLHRVYDTTAFLHGAATNASNVAPGAIGAMLLAESRGEGAMERLRTFRDAQGEWSIEPTDEPESLLIRRGRSPVLVAIAGRQFETAERVEVLALLHGTPLREGAPLADTLGEMRDAGALPVLPWGFGKWIGRRGAVVRDAIRAPDRPLFVGDNGGRPAWGRTPPILAEATRRGIPMLPGSDPLPLRDHQGRALSSGFLVDAALDLARPAAGLRDWLLTPGRLPAMAGQRESSGRFVWNQVRMQWRKRVTARA